MRNEIPSDRKKVNPATDILFASAITAILAIIVFSRQPYLHLTYDSYDYIAASAGANIYLHGKNPDGFSYLVRAPLMPMYLHPFDDKVFAGALLNVLAFGVAVFTCLKIGRLFIHDRVILGTFMLSVIVSYSFLQVHFFLWTEAAFAAITVVLLYCIVTERAVCQVIILLALAFLLRKAAGFTTLAVAAVYVSQGRTRQAMVISAAMLILFIGWEAFAFFQIGVSASGKTLSYHIAFSRIPYLDSVTSWVLPRILPLIARIFLVITLLITAFFTTRPAFIALWRNKNNRSLFLFWSVYVFSMMIFWGARDFDEADRYLSVVLPCFMLTCFSLFACLPGTQKGKRRVRLLILLWLFFPISKCAYYLFMIHF